MAQTVTLLDAEETIRVMVSRSAQDGEEFVSKSRHTWKVAFSVHYRTPRRKRGVLVRLVHEILPTGRQRGVEWPTVGQRSCPADGRSLIDSSLSSEREALIVVTLRQEGGG
jgi:hypothetical protein